MGKNRERAKTWWSSNTKNQKIWFIISAIITGFFLLFALLIISAKEIGATEISDALFGEGVSGWHWFASSLGGIGLKILGTISIACIGVIVAFLSNFLIGIFTWKGKRSRTIGSLIKSLIKYIIVIVCLGFILSTWGVDVASIIAGLGIVTLIIGLGCQSLISDIVSGLFVVFDDFFDVGDIVVIDGFRGTISEIGLRSTKLTDWAGNIKAINNSQITTVTNLSRLATSIAITFYVDREEDIQRVEAVIADNLQAISQRIPKMIAPLQYRGINGLEETGFKLSFLTTCEEGDKFQVNRDVLRELYLTMINNGIKVPFNKIYIQQEAERETIKATEEEKEKANQLNEVNRVAQPKK